MKTKNYSFEHFGFTGIIEVCDGIKYTHKFVIRHLRNGKFHRTDGPAIEYADGTKYWYLNGKLFVDFEEDWKGTVRMVKE